MTAWEIGTKFKIVGNESTGVCTIDSCDSSSVYPYGISWEGTSGDSGSNSCAYSKESIDRAFNRNIWVLVEDSKPDVGTRIRVTGVPGWSTDWRTALPVTEDDIHVTVAGPTNPSQTGLPYVMDSTGVGPLYVRWEPISEENKEMTTLPRVGDMIRVTGAEFIRDLSQQLDGDIHKVIEVVPDGSLGHRVYVNTKNEGKIYVEWEKVEQDEPSELESLKAAVNTLTSEATRLEETVRRLSEANSEAAAFRQDMLTELAKQAENPDCGCDRYCESFDAFMIRRGYSREEVEEARNDATPMEEYEITIRITGRAGVGGESGVASALMERVSDIDSDWEGTSYDYNRVDDE